MPENKLSERVHEWLVNNAELLVKVIFILSVAFLVGIATWLSRS